MPRTIEENKERLQQVKTLTRVKLFDYKLHEEEKEEEEQEPEQPSTPEE